MYTDHIQLLCYSFLFPLPFLPFLFALALCFPPPRCTKEKKHRILWKRLLSLNTVISSSVHFSASNIVHSSLWQNKTPSPHPSTSPSIPRRAPWWILYSDHWEPWVFQSLLGVLIEFPSGNGQEGWSWLHGGSIPGFGGTSALASLLYFPLPLHQCLLCLAFLMMGSLINVLLCSLLPEILASGDRDPVFFCLIKGEWMSYGKVLAHSRWATDFLQINIFWFVHWQFPTDT